MKTFFTFIFAMTLGAAALASGFKTEALAISNLKKYTVADSTKGDEHIADMVVEVDSAVAYAMTHKASQDLYNEIARVSSITLKNDPTAAVGDVLVPLYKKNRKALQDAIKTLPKADANSLTNAIKNAVRELESGNG